jgi:hypothetical protein
MRPGEGKIGHSSSWVALPPPAGSGRMTGRGSALAARFMD